MMGEGHNGIVSGVWAISDIGGNPLDWIARAQPAAILSRVASKTAEPKAVQRSGNFAIVPITGTMTKYRSMFTGWFTGSPSTEVQDAIEQAAADDSIDGILLAVESGGGEARGVPELADSIYKARSKKPVVAFIEDVGASAAYFAASQSTKIIASKASIVGSIGTYSVVQDLSGMAQQAGVKIHVIRAGEMKGAGTPGTEITPDQLAEFQKIVDGINAHFLSAVGRGRKMSAPQVQKIADGRAFMAPEAKQLNLIDSIGTFDDALAALTALAASHSNSTASQAASDPGQTDPGKMFYTQDEATEALKCDVAAIGQFVSGGKLQEFKDGPRRMYKSRDVVTLRTELGITCPLPVREAVKYTPSTSVAATSAVSASAPKSKPQPPKGASMSVPTGHYAVTDPTEQKAIVKEFNALCESIAEKKKCSRHDAVSKAVRENPILHAKYLSACNRGKPFEPSV